MASISVRRNKDGEPIGYKILVCTGRDQFNRQVWRSTTIKTDDERIAGLTPRRLEDELKTIAHTLSKQWKKEWEEEFDGSTGRQPKQKRKNYSLVELLDLWIANNRTAWRPQTTETFLMRRKTIIQFFGRNIKLSAVDRLALDEFVAWLRATKNFKYNTIRSVFVALRCAYNYAVDIGAAAKNPLANYRLKNTDDQPESVDYLTPAESVAFVGILERETKRTDSAYWECFGKVLLFSGVRKGEGLGLMWKDYDAENRKLRISRSVSHGANGGSVIVGTKTRKSRSVPVSAGLSEVLDRFHSEQVQKYGERLTGDCYIFCTVDNPADFAGASSPESWMQRMRKRYGDEIPSKLHWHVLRHPYVKTATTLF